MDFLLVTFCVWELITVNLENGKWPVAQNVKSAPTHEKWAWRTKCAQGLIIMFSISVLINGTIHLPEREKLGEDMRNQRLFFHREEQGEKKAASLLLSSGHFCTLVLFDWRHSSLSLRSEDGDISAAPYWICSEEAPSDTRYHLWQHAEINSGDVHWPSPHILHWSSIWATKPTVTCCNTLLLTVQRTGNHVERIGSHLWMLKCQLRSYWSLKLFLWSIMAIKRSFLTVTFLLCINCLNDSLCRNSTFIFQSLSRFCW